MNDPRYRLLIVSSTRRHLTEDLPEAVATAAFEFMTEPLLENPHPRREAAPPNSAGPAQRATRFLRSGPSRGADREAL